MAIVELLSHSVLPCCLGLFLSFSTNKTIEKSMYIILAILRLRVITSLFLYISNGLSPYFALVNSINLGSTGTYNDTETYRGNFAYLLAGLECVRRIEVSYSKRN